MMKVFYRGTQTGLHRVGRQAIRLLPGENTVMGSVGKALIKAGICEPLEQKRGTVEVRLPEWRRWRSRNEEES